MDPRSGSSKQKPRESSARDPSKPTKADKACSCGREAHARHVRSEQAACADRLSPADVVHFIKPHIAVHLQRCVRLAEKIDEAFAGQPFLPHLPPTAPRNRARFNAYCRMHRKASEMRHQVMEEWLRAHALQDLASHALAVLNGQGEENRGQIPFPSQVSEADLRLAEQFAKGRSNPNFAVWKTNEEDK